MKHFPVGRGLIRRKIVGLVRAVRLTFEIARGETLALVGEIGLRQVDDRPPDPAPDRSDGRVGALQGRPTPASTATLRRLRRHMQIIFQDPYASLNPRMTVGEIVASR